MDARTMFDILDNAAHSRGLTDGEGVFHRGDAADNMYGVLSGGVCLSRDTVDGTRTVIHRACADDLFAEASLFSDRYHCDGTAVGETVVGVFPKQTVLRLLQNDAEFAMAFTRRLAVQVQRLRTGVELRAIRSAEERVLTALALKLEAGQHSLTLPTTWKAFAQEIGLTHEALYRALKRLEADGRLERDGSWVSITGAAD